MGNASTDQDRENVVVPLQLPIETNIRALPPREDVIPPHAFSIALRWGLALSAGFAGGCVAMVFVVRLILRGIGG